MLQASSQLLLVGSVVFVEIAGPEGLLIRETAGREALHANEPARLEQGTQVVFGTLSDATPYLDVTVPLSWPEATGSVRIGVDLSSVRLETRNVALIAAGAGIGFDAMILLVFACVWRGRRRSDPAHPRSVPSQSEAWVVGDLVIYPALREAHFLGRPLRLTPKQYTVLHLLASEAGRAFSEGEILAAAWPDSPYADAKDIKQCIYLLRKKLASLSEQARDLIITVPGFGYRLATEPVDVDLTES